MANVDNETEKSIQKILKSHFKDCTMITIAHRLNTIMHCDLDFFYFFNIEKKRKGNLNRKVYK